MTAVVSIGITEKLVFTLFETPCCRHRLCWVQPKPPLYCPSCGASIAAQIRSGDCTLKQGIGWFRFEESRAGNGP